MALGERRRQYFETDDGRIRIGGARQRSFEPAGHSAIEPDGPWLGLDLDSVARRNSRTRESDWRQLEWRGATCAGRHDVRLLNRAEAIDLEQSLDIAPDSMTSVVVEYLPTTLQTAACPAGQCGSKPGLSAQSR